MLVFMGRSIRQCSVKKVFLEISQDSQENTSGTGTSDFCQIWLPDGYDGKLLSERIIFFWKNF